MKKVKIKDIYEGEIVQIWEDGETIYLTIGLTTVGIPKEEWKELKKELKEIK